MALTKAYTIGWLTDSSL